MNDYTDEGAATSEVEGAVKLVLQRLTHASPQTQLITIKVMKGTLSAFFMAKLEHHLGVNPRDDSLLDAAMDAAGDEVMGSLSHELGHITEIEGKFDELIAAYDSYLTCLNAAIHDKAETN